MILNNTTNSKAKFAVMSTNGRPNHFEVAPHTFSDLNLKQSKAPFTVSAEVQKTIRGLVENIRKEDCMTVYPQGLEFHMDHSTAGTNV